MNCFNNIIYDCRKHFISPKTTKERERKWLHMTADWDNQLFKNFKKVIAIQTILYVTFNPKIATFYRYKTDVEKVYHNQLDQELGCT